MKKSYKYALAVTFAAALAVGVTAHLGGVGAGSPAAQGDKLVLRVDSLMPGYTIEELVQQADLIVSEKVSDSSEAFAIRPLDGQDPRFYHDVSFKVGDVLKGSADAATPLQVRVEGGEGTYVATENESAPDFLPGDEYLLFLYRIGNGAAYNTEGSHAYVIGTATGAWPLADGDGGRYESPCWQPDGAGDASIDDVKAVVASLPAGDETSSARTYGVSGRMDEIEAQHEQGVITDEEYEEYVTLAEREQREFAKVLTAEEQLEFEESMLREHGSYL